MVTAGLTELAATVTYATCVGSTSSTPRPGAFHDPAHCGSPNLFHSNGFGLRSIASVTTEVQTPLGGDRPVEPTTWSMSAENDVSWEVHRIVIAGSNIVIPEA
jgi:hypothetical protein